MIPAVETDARPKPPRKKKKKTELQKQMARLDSYFSEYIRLKYMDPKTKMCLCVTCRRWKPWNMRKTSAGHFIDKHNTKNLRVRWMEKNVHPQCYQCNTFYSGNKYEYFKYLEATYGEGTCKYLEMYATKPFNPKVFKMKEKIVYYRVQCKKLKSEKLEYQLTME